MHAPSATYGHALELSSSEQHVGKTISVRTGGTDPPPLFWQMSEPYSNWWADYATPTTLLFVPPGIPDRPTALVGI